MFPLSKVLALIHKVNADSVEGGLVKGTKKQVEYKRKTKNLSIEISKGYIVAELQAPCCPVSTCR